MLDLIFFRETTSSGATCHSLPHWTIQTTADVSDKRATLAILPFKVKLNSYRDELNRAVGPGQIT